jgi:peptidoglycan/LPS O-acetylase OafA/YrhL
MEEHGWRRRDLDRGKTLAILLVVFGHLVAREDPPGGGWGAAWYEPARAAVYAFHIPFLFYLSGYAAQWSGATRARGAAYRDLLLRRANRLLLPALVFGLVILIGKMAVMDELHVDHAPGSFLGGLADLVWRTDRSPAQSVWYLIVLFVYAAAAPALLPWLRRYGPMLLLASAPLALLPTPPILYADRIVTFVPFFLAGMVAADDDNRWCRWLDTWRVPLALLFACALGLDLAQPRDARCEPCGLAGAACHGQAVAGRGATAHRPTRRLRLRHLSAQHHLHRAGEGLADEATTLGRRVVSAVRSRVARRGRRRAHRREDAAVPAGAGARPPHALNRKSGFLF